MKALFLTVPNFLTILRILLIFPIWVLLSNGNFQYALLVTLLAFFTDFLDGFWARKRNAQSVLGAWLDPLADKAIVFVLLLFFFRENLILPEYFYLSTIRDLSQVMAFPVIMIWKKNCIKVKPRFIPKLATVLKFTIAFSCVLIMINSSKKTQILLNYLMIVSSFFEVYVILIYMKRFYYVFNGKYNTFE